MSKPALGWSTSATVTGGQEDGPGCHDGREVGHLLIGCQNRRKAWGMSLARQALIERFGLDGGTSDSLQADGLFCVGHVGGIVVHRHNARRWQVHRAVTERSGLPHHGGRTSWRTPALGCRSPVCWQVEVAVLPHASVAVRVHVRVTVTSPAQASATSSVAIAFEDRDRGHPMRSPWRRSRKVSLAQSPSR